MTTNRTTEAKGTGEYAEVNGINLYYETHGTGRPLILLHGGLGSGEMFGPILPALSERHLVILPDLQGHEDVAARFQREIKVLAALNHPNIATLHTALTIDNQLVMIMEYVEGESVSGRLSRGRRETRMPAPCYSDRPSRLSSVADSDTQ